MAANVLGIIVCFLIAGTHYLVGVIIVDGAKELLDSAHDDMQPETFSFLQVSTISPLISHVIASDLHDVHSRSLVDVCRLKS